MIELNKIEESVKIFLEAIGENLNREGLVETPKRVAKMVEQVFNFNSSFDEKQLIKTFHSNFDGIVLVRDINFFSICEHHLMPFFGKAHLAYIPNGKVIGLSKIARIVNFHAKRLQLQERLTQMVVNTILNSLDVKGLIVLLEATHTCMTLRGVKKVNSKTVTISAKGVFENDERLQNIFFKSIKFEK